jgi:hypothetical protein
MTGISVVLKKHFDNKISQATSRVNWLKDKNTNVSRTISVLILRVPMCLVIQSVSYIYIYLPFCVHDGALASGSCWFLSSTCNVTQAF